MIIIFYFVKSKIENILGFTGHMISVAAAQLCQCNVKAAIDSM